MNKKRVVVTGLGSVTPLGNDVESTWSNILAGKTGVGPLTRLNADDYPAKVAAELKDFNIEDFGVERKEARKMDRFTHYAIAASLMAVKDSKLDITDENRSSRRRMDRFRDWWDGNLRTTIRNIPKTWIPPGEPFLRSDDHTGYGSGTSFHHAWG